MRLSSFRAFATSLTIAVFVMLASIASGSSAVAWSGSISIQGTVTNGTVCAFSIHGTSFLKSSTGTWAIKAGSTTTLNGSWSANAMGEWSTASISTLANGSYMAEVHETGAPDTWTASFRVQCGAGTTTGTSTSTSTSGSTTTGTSSSTTTGTTTTGGTSGGTTGGNCNDDKKSDDKGKGDDKKGDDKGKGNGDDKGNDKDC